LRFPEFEKEALKSMQMYIYIQCLLSLIMTVSVVVFWDCVDSLFNEMEL